MDNSWFTPTYKAEYTQADAKYPVIKIHQSTYRKLAKYCKEHGYPMSNIASQAINYALSNTGEGDA